MSAAPSPAKPDPAVAEALALNVEAAAEVKAIADELAVVHAVLESPLASPKEVAKATERTGEAESQLHDAADKLDLVNAALERASSP